VNFICVKIDLRFVGRIIDTCNDDAVKASKEWSVQCFAKIRIDGTIEPDTKGCR